MSDPDGDRDQDWRTRWQAAKKKLEICSDELNLYPDDSAPIHQREPPRKPPEKKDKLVKFCFSCLKCKEEGQTMWRNLLARGTCMRPIFICKACQKKILSSVINGIE